MTLETQTAWQGLFPAVTTKFAETGEIDPDACAQSFARQIEGGVDGLIVAGSLGEGGVLSLEEKLELVRIALQVAGDDTPVLATIAETNTAAACLAAAEAEQAGAHGLMVLPPMQYRSDHRETVGYLRSVALASELPVMIYNNPVAYGVDVSPAMFDELSAEWRFVAIKESSDDVRRITEIRRLLDDRYKIFIGVDNLALEAACAGADGWVAGLCNAFPQESVALWQLAHHGRLTEARVIYQWFRPLLDLDVNTKLVQNIKLVETLVHGDPEHMREPRLPLDGIERQYVEEIVREAIETRPDLPNDL